MGWTYPAGRGYAGRMDRLFVGLLVLLSWTWRVRRTEPVAAWLAEGPAVVVFRHGHLLPMLLLHRDLPIAALASRSGDGALAARVAGALGYPVFRGSSSRGGLEASREALRLLDEGLCPALAVDGPRGPAGEPHPGALALAARGGVPVVWGFVRASGWQARSWDGFLVPWPFARVELRYGRMAVEAGRHGRDVATAALRGVLTSGG